MKGGKDMKKTYSFEEKEDMYVVTNGKEEVFEVKKDNLKIDGNIFYEAFFEKFSIGDEIEFKKGNSVRNDDKLSVGVFDTLNTLINDIVKKIIEMEIN